MGSPAYAYSHTYIFSATHSIVFLSDNLRNTLREVIRENGLDPSNLMQDWEDLERAIKTWLRSGHLRQITIEFFKPGSLIASARWDLPVGYSGSGVNDDMWLDRAYLRQLIAKSARPTSDCIYRVLLGVDKEAPPVAGFGDCAYLATGQLAARQAGTVIATGHLTASATFWK